MIDRFRIFSKLREPLPGCFRIVILLVFVTLIASSGNCNLLLAQDIIILKTGDEIKSSVIEIGIEQVRYKKFENPDGPVYNLEKSKIFMIKYQNGTKDVFNEVPEKQQEVISPKETNISRSEPGEPLNTNGQRVFLNNEKLSASEVRRLLAPYPKALHMYNSGRVLYGFDLVVEIVGVTGFVVFYMEGENVPAFGVLLSAAVGSGVLLYFSNNNIKSSISLYNFNISQVSYKVNFGIQKYGVGFAVKF